LKPLLDDGFAALKQLHQKVATLSLFPNVSEREEMINGMKVEAKCRFVDAVPVGRQQQNYRYQVYFKFTNCTPQTLKLLDAHVLTKDETLNEIKRDGRNNQSPFLLSSGTYEHVTTVTIPTKSGSCICDYLFVDLQTGTFFPVPVPPLLLSTHDPDVAYREASYRGDPNADIKVEVQPYQPDFSQTEIEKSPSKNDDGKNKIWLNSGVTRNLITTGVTKEQSLKSSLNFHVDRDEESHEEIGAKTAPQLQ